jgi:omega-amidase
MQDLNIAIIQTHLYWEDIDANIEHFTKKINAIEQADIIILPEMFSTGFSMQPHLFAKKSTEKVIPWLMATAIGKKCAIVGSIMNENSGKYYNSLIFMKPDGNYEMYHKRHLFSPGEETKHYTAGKEKLIVEYLGWKFCTLICYDLRFPVFSRNTENYDALIYIANWPEKRDYAWRQLLIARAIENQCYVISCNRVGEDANGIQHKGNSGIINYVGEAIGNGSDDCVMQFWLSQKHLLDYRKDFNVLADLDKFTLE